MKLMFEPPCCFVSTTPLTVICSRVARSPLSENVLHLRWIVFIFFNIKAIIWAKYFFLRWITWWHFSLKSLSWLCMLVFELFCSFFRDCPWRGPSPVSMKTLQGPRGIFRSDPSQHALDSSECATALYNPVQLPVILLRLTQRDQRAAAMCHNTTVNKQ